MATVYCLICGDIEWVDELEDDIIGSHVDCLEEYLKIERERNKRMNKKEIIEKGIEGDLMYNREAISNGSETVP